MKMITVGISALAIALAGCASTDDKRGDAGRPQQPVPDKVPPVAKAVPQAGAKAPDDLALVRDPGNRLSRRSVFFDYDNFDIKSEYGELIERHGKFLANRKDIKIMVQGNADERGSHEYNLALGQKRADAVRRALVLHGASDGQIETISFGEEKPRAIGHNEQAWSQNRRADIAYPGDR